MNGTILKYLFAIVGFLLEYRGMIDFCILIFPSTALQNSLIHSRKGAFFVCVFPVIFFLM